MPPNRIEQPVPGPAEASAAAPAPASASSAGGFKAWLPLIATLLLMPLLAYLMTTLVLVPRVQKGLGVTSATAAEPAEAKRGATTAKKDTVPMNKLLVNVAGTMGSRYLLVSLSLVGSDAEFKTKVQDVEPQLRDLACGALSTKTLADLEKPGARNLIRSELISGFNNILGGAVVQEIYLTEFAIQ
jgi:flagellar FliL protein